jgi:hypothetical protein
MFKKTSLDEFAEIVSKLKIDGSDMDRGRGRGTETEAGGDVCDEENEERPAHRSRDSSTPEPRACCHHQESLYLLVFGLRMYLGA